MKSFDDPKFEKNLFFPMRVFCGCGFGRHFLRRNSSRVPGLIPNTQTPDW